MSLRINHNIAAFDAHRNLNLTTRSLSSSMEKLSSGFRINRASDDPAGLVISEQFRAQIAGLNRAIENSEGSMNMIQTAEGALTEINNLLIKMRELAIHAANEGFNDTTQLAADQEELNNSIATIDRISVNTQFGTKNLLDGSRANTATITSSDTSGVTIKESGLTTGTHSVVATKTADASATINSTSLGVDLKTGGTVNNLADGLHTMDVLQASAAATRTTETIDFQDDFGNNLTVANAATFATLNSGAMAAAAATAGNAGQYDLVIDYQEAGSNAVGQQTIQVTVAAGDTAGGVAVKLQAALDANGVLANKLDVTTSGDGSRLVYIKPKSEGAGYSLNYVSETDGASTTFFSWGAARDSRGASDDLVKMTVTTNNVASVTDTLNLATGATTSITFASFAGMVTELNRALQDAYGSVAAGAGAVNNITATKVSGEDKIIFATSDEGSDYSIKIDSNGTAEQNAENILGLGTADLIDRTGVDALIAFDGYTNQVTSVNYASTRDVNVANKAAGETGRGTIDLTINTAASGVDVGDLLVTVEAAKFSVRLNGGPATEATAGVDTTVWNSGRTEWLKVNYDLTAAGGTESVSNTDSSLVFQIGANVGQTAKIAISNMKATQLGTGIAGNAFTSLSEINVTTVAGAQDSQTVIDAAITEVSNLRGKLGSFQKNTLESNLRNLRISSQNLTASESAIRDTDMAKEMSTFVRYQILLQAGTAMLAQANQVPQVVLSLFR